ncbi:hypothetical protein BDY19DRAFT_988136 [Irpex rosettiformis]|uniref:Uncharacterized protein n=1 Tax=Irpex rosettiformis TaxID=378272 RepID=A0ACB8UJH4_9APHY|nr:hypothetical protein BDY19DRAFT_988136 [Irpex rosettiformis]
MSNSSQWYVVVDDASAKVNYKGDWSNRHSTNARNSTLSVSSTAGSTASFTFTGNYVAVYGAVLFDDANNPPISTYTIDGQTPGIFIPNLQQNNTFTTFFVSPKLADSEHTLQIGVANDGVPVFLDSILFNATTVAQVTSGGQQPTIIITTIIAPPSSTASTSEASANSKSVPVGPIVGGVVGGVTILISAILAFYFLYVKPKRNQWNYHATSLGDFYDSDYKPDYEYKPQENVTPFQAGTLVHSPAPTARTESVYSRSSYHPTDAAASPSFSQYPYPPGPAPSRQTTLLSLLSSADHSTTSHAPSTGPSTGTAYIPPVLPLRIGQRKALEARSQATRQTTDPVQHTDSGCRFDDSGSSTAGGSLMEPEMPQELPPTYSER